MSSTSASPVKLTHSALIRVASRPVAKRRASIWWMAFMIRAPPPLVARSPRHSLGLARPPTPRW